MSNCTPTVETASEDRIARPAVADPATPADPHDMLVRMANQIGEFFASMPDPDEARGELAAHIRQFWEPRMRRKIFEHIDRTQGHDLREMVLTALTQHRAELMPGI